MRSHRQPAVSFSPRVERKVLGRNGAIAKHEATVRKEKLTTLSEELVILLDIAIEQVPAVLLDMRSMLRCLGACVGQMDSYAAGLTSLWVLPWTSPSTP